MGGGGDSRRLEWIFQTVFREAGTGKSAFIWVCLRTCDFQRRDESIKVGERRRRSKCERLELLYFSLSTKIPVHRDRLWAYAMNKEALQRLCRDYFNETAHRENLTIVLSGYVSNSDDEIT